MQTWPEVSCGGLHLTEGQPAHSSTTLGHDMSLPGGWGTSGLCDQSHHTWPQDVSAWGRVRVTFCLIGSQPASLPAAIAQPTSEVTKYQPVRLWVGHMVAGGQGA